MLFAEDPAVAGADAVLTAEAWRVGELGECGGGSVLEFAVPDGDVVGDGWETDGSASASGDYYDSWRAGGGERAADGGGAADLLVRGLAAGAEASEADVRWAPGEELEGALLGEGEEERVAVSELPGADVGDGDSLRGEVCGAAVVKLAGDGEKQFEAGSGALADGLEYPVGAD